MPEGDLIPGGFIDLLSRGKLKSPTEETVQSVLRLNAMFEDLHGGGTNTRECRNTEVHTVKFLMRRCPDIQTKFIKLFVKIKYTKKINDKVKIPK